MPVSSFLQLITTALLSNEGPAFEVSNIQGDLRYYSPGEVVMFGQTQNGQLLLTTYAPCTIEFYLSPFCNGPECQAGMYGWINLGLESNCSCDCTTCTSPFYADWQFASGTPLPMIVNFDRGERIIYFSGKNMNMILQALNVDEDPFTYCRSDTNIDGVVDFSDLLQVINDWGITCE